ARKCRRLLAELLANGADQRAHARRFRVSDLEQTFKTTLFRKQCQSSADGFWRGEFARFASAPQKIEERGIGIRKTGPRLRPPCVNDRVSTDKLSGQTESAGGNLAPPRGLRCKAQQTGGCDPRGKDLLAAGGGFLDRGGGGRGPFPRPLPAGGGERPS